jgi:hypothetical protein
VSLRAPIAVTVEVRGQARGGARRAFRLAEQLGEDGLRLERRAPFDVGRPVALRFVLPAGGRKGDGGEWLELDAEVRPADGDDRERDEADGGGGRELIFLAPSADDRRALRRYVMERLGLSESLS